MFQAFLALIRRLRAHGRGLSMPKRSTKLGKARAFQKLRLLKSDTQLVFDRSPPTRYCPFFRASRVPFSDPFLFYLFVRFDIRCQYSETRLLCFVNLHARHSFYASDLDCNPLKASRT
jgi:hypothetical protein